MSPEVLRTHLMTAPIALHPLAVRHRRGRHGSNYAAMFTPRGWTEAGPTLLYFHRGGDIADSPTTHRDLVARIAHASLAGVDVERQVEPGMVHVFQLFASFAPECGPAIARIGSHLRQRASQPSPRASSALSNAG